MQRRLGYYVGMAYLPEQKLQDGVVHIFALEGRLDDIKVRWPAALPVQHEVIERYLAQLKPGAILREDDIERVVYLVNDLPGVRARFEIEPGREPGTASLVVTPVAESRIGGRLEYDTLGPRNTGVSRFGVRAAIASPTGLGDALQLTLRGSAGGGLDEGGVSYSVPVAGSGLKLGAVLSEVRYFLPSVAVLQNIHGTAELGNVFGLYPVVRSRNLNLFALATFAHKRFEDRWESQVVRRSTHSFQLGVLGDFRDDAFGGAVSTYELSLLQGGVSLGPVYSLTGLQANYRKLDASWSRLQSLVPGRLHLYLRARGQFTNTNLDPSERMPVGGADGVRAFDPAEGAADDAQLLTAELRWLPPASLFGNVAHELAFSAFYDWGHVRYAHAPEALGVIAAQLLGPDNRATLGAVGAGVLWERPNDFTVRFDLAWRVQGQSSIRPHTHLPRAEVALSKAF
jgi:hemolysin activation/secretion protein